MSTVAALGAAIVACAPATAGAAGLASDLGPGVEVTRQDETGKVGFIGTDPGQPIDVGLPGSASPAQVAKALVNDHAQSFGLAAPDAGLRVEGVNPAAGNGTSVRLQQLVGGLPVLGGELVVDLDHHNDVLSVLGETSPAPHGRDGERQRRRSGGAPPSTSVAGDTGVDAERSERERAEARGLRPAPALGARRAAARAHRLGARGDRRRDLDQPVDELVVVDAEIGAVALHFDQVETAKSRFTSATPPTARASTRARRRTRGPRARGTSASPTSTTPTTMPVTPTTSTSAASAATASTAPACR